MIISIVNYIYGMIEYPLVEKIENLVSVLIPARNEEKNIANIINDIRSQFHRNLEIIIFDDQSNDNTLKIVEKLQKEDSRIKLISSTGLPEGWLGKNYACDQLAKEAKGDYFLFLDADVRIDREAIGTMVAKAKHENLSLLSIFPMQIMKSFGEWLIVPTMNHILLTLLLLPLVNKTHFRSLSAANGQFMLFRDIDYELIRPHQQLKNEKVEDIAISRLFKGDGKKVECLASVPSVKCKMYENGMDAIQGFSKNVIHFFGRSYIVAITYWFISFFGVILTLFFGSFDQLILLITAIIISRTMTSVTSHQNTIFNLGLHFLQTLALGIIIFSSIINHKNKSFQWKGRTIS